MKRLDDVNFSMEQFEKELDCCLEIKSYPSKNQRYYECFHYSAALEKRLVNVYIV